MQPPLGTTHSLRVTWKLPRSPDSSQPKEVEHYPCWTWFDQKQFSYGLDLEDCGRDGCRNDEEQLDDFRIAEYEAVVDQHSLDLGAQLLQTCKIMHMEAAPVL